MWSHYIIAMSIILGIALAWVAVQQMSRRFAARHPEYGPATENLGCCASACSCEKTEPCSRRKSPTKMNQPLSDQEEKA